MLKITHKPCSQPEKLEKTEASATKIGKRGRKTTPIP